MKRKIEYILNQVKEIYQEQDKKIKNKKKLKERKKARKEELKIIEFRAQYMTTELIKKENKGEVFAVKWKNINLGEFIGEGLPQATIENIKQHKFSKNLLNVVAKKDAPLRCFTLYNGLTNWCKCGEIDMSKEAFIRHVKRHHNGIILAKSSLNRPFWLDCIKFTSTALEEEFCFTMSELTYFYFPEENRKELNI